MWKDLPLSHKEEYKRIILAFASLTAMFAQKNVDEACLETDLVPIINSKFQETVFQKTFNASAEDIGNTSYDAAIRNVDGNGHETKYLIGIKTFGIGAGAQKIAQFKANHNEWASIINQIQMNANGLKSKNEIDEANIELYTDLAKKIAYLRNMRIDSSKANLKGFDISIETDEVQSIYHVLMPSKKGEAPSIYVGEMPYDKIEEDHIKIIGCTSANSPTNFNFTDGNHIYRFTSADSQLLMEFNNNSIVQEQWNVKFADDAYKIFSDLSKQIYGGTDMEIIDSVSWMIADRKTGKVNMFSGFNSFYGVGSKLAKDQKESRISKLHDEYLNEVNRDDLNEVIINLKKFLLDNTLDRDNKIEIRKHIVKIVEETQNVDFKKSVLKLIFRPVSELYIPIPMSKSFHTERPDFFGKDIGKCFTNPQEFALSPEGRQFNLVFEPSGEVIRSFITQDNGKAIESIEKQSKMGDWILRGVFQLKEYEPLTNEKLNTVGINGIRLYKLNGSDDVHLKFVWLDPNNLPEDYIK